MWFSLFIETADKDIQYVFLYLGILDLRAKQTCLLQLDDICIEEAEESDFDFF